MKHKYRLILPAALAAVLLGTIPTMAAVNAGGFTRPSVLAADDAKVFCVTDYGAVSADGNDDTKAFQDALNAAAPKKGTVVVPRGNYTFKNGTLTVPAGVTLQGADPSATPGGSEPRIDIYATKGSDNSAFITLKEGAKLAGLYLNYPVQSATRPSAYGWAVRLSGTNIRVAHIYCKNAWRFMDITGASDHVVEHCNIWAYDIGVRVDKCNGTGLLKDIHIWPFDGSTNTWVNEKATGFLLGYAKNETLDGCFTIRYHVGYHFVNNGSGGGNYTLQTSGADCGPTGLLVDNVASLKVTSGQFMHRAEIRSTNTGKVSLIACNFRKWSKESVSWQVMAQGSGAVTLDSCTFGSWDSKADGTAAVVSDGAPLTVIGCDFMDGKTAVSITAKTKSATVTQNLMKGSVQVKNASKGTVTVDKNATY